MKTATSTQEATQPSVHLRVPECPCVSWGVPFPRGRGWGRRPPSARGRPGKGSEETQRWPRPPRSTRRVRAERSAGPRRRRGSPRPAWEPLQPAGVPPPRARRTPSRRGRPTSAAVRHRSGRRTSLPQVRSSWFTLPCHVKAECLVRESSRPRDGGQLYAQTPLGQMLTGRTKQEPEEKEGFGRTDVTVPVPPAGMVIVCLSAG